MSTAKRPTSNVARLTQVFGRALQFDSVVSHPMPACLSAIDMPCDVGTQDSYRWYASRAYLFANALA